MKLDKWLLIGVSSVLITVFLLLTVWYRKSERNESDAKARAHAERLVRSYSPILGPQDAPVTIVEFLDPECEACRALYPMVKDLMKRYEGKVRLVVRYMPLHGNSMYAASVLEAARKQGKYWEALETLFANQPEWGSHHHPRPELILGYMKELGLDMDRMKDSLEDSEHKSKIRQDHQDGNDLGVTRTPAFFVNGKVLHQLGYDELQHAIESELKP